MLLLGSYLPHFACLDDEFTSQPFATWPWVRSIGFWLDGKRLFKTSKLFGRFNPVYKFCNVEEFNKIGFRENKGLFSITEESKYECGTIVHMVQANKNRKKLFFNEMKLGSTFHWFWHIKVIFNGSTQWHLPPTTFIHEVINPTKEFWVQKMHHEKGFTLTTSFSYFITYKLFNLFKGGA